MAASCVDLDIGKRFRQSNGAVSPLSVLLLTNHAPCADKNETHLLHCTESLLLNVKLFHAVLICGMACSRR